MALRPTLDLLHAVHGPPICVHGLWLLHGEYALPSHFGRPRLHFIFIVQVTAHLHHSNSVE